MRAISAPLDRMDVSNHVSKGDPRDTGSASWLPFSGYLRSAHITSEIGLFTHDRHMSVKQDVANIQTAKYNVPNRQISI
jgi:hypothetical protein